MLADFIRSESHPAYVESAGRDFWPTVGVDPSPDDWKAADRMIVPGWSDFVERSVVALADFEPNWDGYGAKPFTSAMLRAVRRFLDRLGGEQGDVLLKPGTEDEFAFPYCVPVPTGAVQLEWHVGDRILELEFETPDEIHYLQWWPGHELVNKEDVYAADDLDQSVALIRWVLTG